MTGQTVRMDKTVRTELRGRMAIHPSEALTTGQPPTSPPSSLQPSQAAS